MIKDLKLTYKEIENNIFKCDRFTMEYILKNDCNLRAMSELPINDETKSEQCYERVVHYYCNAEGKIRGFSYQEFGGVHFDEGSLEYDGDFYIFDILYHAHEGGIYCTNFEDDVKFT